MRKLFAEKLLDLGNIALGALVFGHVLNRGVFQTKFIGLIGMGLF